MSEAHEAHLPSVADRRTMAQNALAQMKEQGYLARLNLIVLEAQKATPKEKAAGLKALREQIENAKSAVARLEKEIADLGEAPDA